MGPEGSNLKISEQGQDFFALEQNAYREHQFFVEVGASDGLTASNTFILEKFYKWQGICVDPNPAFMQSLMNCRDSFVSTLCVYNETGKILPFKFCVDDSQFYGWNFRAGLTDHVGNINPDIDKCFVDINVLTITLTDLLDLYKAPTNIGYISLDTEGSEYEILKSFDFEKYNVKCWTIEHEFSDDRSAIQQLMKDNGYTRFIDYNTGNEDWYFKN